MASLNDVTLAQLIDLFAEAVVAKLEARPLERDFGTAEAKFDHNVEVANNAAATVDAESTEQFVPETPPVGFPKPKVVLDNSNYDKRKEELSKETVISLRKQIAAAEDRLSSDYSHLKKPDLVKYIVDFETVIGHRIDETTEPSEEDNVPDDTSVDSEPEDDADEEVDLDREGALQLGISDFGALKAIAVDNGVEPADLKGLDVEAIVDLLFGSEEDEDAAEEPASTEADEDEGDDTEITLDEIPDLLPDMSLAEMKELADALEVEYTRKDSTDTLAEKILAAVAEMSE